MARAVQTIVYGVGARPNFIKIAPVIRAVGRMRGVRQLVVHTGQHYDARLSAEILDDLGIGEPDRSLGLGSGSHAEQTGRIMIAFEEVLLEEDPSLVVVGGDVNSTLACALATAKLGIPLAHVEAGLRSWDWGMPEEINRVLTDRLSDLLFTHSPEAGENLVREGIDEVRIHYVGNTMIDSLRRLERRARRKAAWKSLGLSASGYVLVTLHRPSNVDDPARLAAIVEALESLTRRSPVVFPIHPRTLERLSRSGQLERLRRAGAVCTEAVGYLDFLSLQIGSGAILTDSGGIQEEASVLGIPCYTLRANTERPITLSLGTNVLLGDDPRAIEQVELPTTPHQPRSLPLWDGRAGERVATVLGAVLQQEATVPAGAFGAGRS